MDWEVTSSLKAMIHILPPVCPGEALASYATRIALFASLAPSKVQQALFNVPWMRLDWCVPSRLQHFARLTAQITGRPDGQYWLHSHTAFPYYARLSSPERVDVLKSRMLVGNKGPVRPVQALTPMELQVGAPKFCQLCQADGIAQVGFGFGRLVHQLPYVTRCVTHGVALQRLQSWAPSLRIEKAGQGARKCREASIRFAVESERLQWSSGSVPQPGTAAGWTSGGARSRRRSLKLALREAWPGEFDDALLTSLVHSDEGVERLLNCFGPRRLVVHPVAAILLGAVQDMASIAPTSEQSVSTAKEEPGFSARIEVAQRLWVDGECLTQAAHAAGISVTTLSVALQRLGHDVATRPKRVTKAVVNQVVEMLGQGSTPSEVSSALAVSMSTVYRCRVAHPDSLAAMVRDKGEKELLNRRRQWLELREHNELATTTQLRNLDAATYAWLYRHDPTWLKLHPGQEAVRPRERRASRVMTQKATVKLLRAASEAVRGRPGRPQRVTLSRVLAQAGMANVSTTRVTDQIPSLSGALESAQILPPGGFSGPPQRLLGRNLSQWNGRFGVGHQFARRPSPLRGPVRRLRDEGGNVPIPDYQPPLMPGESVFGYLQRLALVGNFGTMKSLLRSVLPVKLIQAPWVIPSHLSTLCERLKSLPSPVTLLERHTIYPAATAFLSEQSKAPS